MNAVSIDTAQNFEHLSRAPIIEAVIDFRARAFAWDTEAFGEILKPQLPEYPMMLLQNLSAMGFRIAPELPVKSEEHRASTGLQFRSADTHNLATLSRDGFTFSRLKPYQHWDQLQSETLRLWQMYVQVAKPSEIQRIGVRFINRVDLPPELELINLEEYISPPPEPPRNFEVGFEGFFHIDSFSIPGHAYTVKVLRTIQPPQSPSVSGRDGSDYRY